MLDVLAKREPFYDSSVRIWSLVESSKLFGAVSAISLNNIYYILRKISGREKALQSIKFIYEVFTIIPLNSAILSLALESDIDDFEDALQYYSARQSRARFLITRNISDFPETDPHPVTAREFIGAVFS